MVLTAIKINELTNEADIADDDELPIWDTSAATTDAVTALILTQPDVDLVIASGALTIKRAQLVTLNLGTAIALTISNAPAVGYWLAIHRKGSGAVTHTVQLPAGVTWDGTNRTANFDTDADNLIAVAESVTRFIVLANNGVTFSA